MYKVVYLLTRFTCQLNNYNKFFIASSLSPKGVSLSIELIRVLLGQLGEFATGNRGAREGSGVCPCDLNSCLRPHSTVLTCIEGPINRIVHRIGNPASRITYCILSMAAKVDMAKRALCSAWRLRTTQYEVTRSIIDRILR